MLESDCAQSCAGPAVLPDDITYRDISVGEAGTLERGGLGLDQEGPHLAHWGHCMRNGRVRH